MKSAFTVENTLDFTVYSAYILAVLYAKQGQSFTQNELRVEQFQDQSFIRNSPQPMGECDVTGGTGSVNTRSNSRGENSVTTPVSQAFTDSELVIGLVGVACPP